MEQRHPFLSAVGETMADIAILGFFLFFMLRPYILDFSFLPLAAEVLLLRLFHMGLLKKSITIGAFAAIHIPVGAAFLFLSFRLISLTEYLPLPSGVFIAALVILFVRTIFLSLFPARPNRTVLVDSLFLLCLIISIWKQFSSVPGLSSLLSFSLWALAWSMADLAASHLPSAEKSSFSASVPLTGAGIALVFVLFSAVMAAVGQTFSNGFIRGLLSVLSAGLHGFKTLWKFLAAAFSYLLSLFPEGSSEYEEPYQLPDSFLSNIEEQAANTNPQAMFTALVILLCILAAVIVYWILKKGLLKKRLAVRETVKSRRNIVFPCFPVLKQFFRSIIIFFRSLFLLLFRPGHISSLLIRAGWYGKRHFHPRKKGETLREYLLRLETDGTMEKTESRRIAASLLAHYGDAYLYGAQTIKPDKKEIQLIKKSFPLI